MVWLNCESLILLTRYQFLRGGYVTPFIFTRVPALWVLSAHFPYALSCTPRMKVYRQGFNPKYLRSEPKKVLIIILPQRNLIDKRPLTPKMVALTTEMCRFLNPSSKFQEQYLKTSNDYIAGNGSF